MKENLYKNNEEIKQLIVRIDLETKQKFNIKCINNNKSMQEVVSDFINKYIED